MLMQSDSLVSLITQSFASKLALTSQFACDLFSLGASTTVSAFFDVNFVGIQILDLTIGWRACVRASVLGR